MLSMIGFKSYASKDDYPIARRISFLHAEAMDNRDPFIEGFRVLLEMRPDLNPAKISTDAGRDNSTLRKLLSGENASPRISTAEALARAAGYSMSTIIALGQNPAARDALHVLQTYETLDRDAQRELASYLDYLASRPSKSAEPDE